MALVTVQRSPSLAGSPQCSISDGEAEEDENGKYERSASSECFFAGKGTALVLALNDIPQSTSERRHSIDSNRSSNSTVSNGSDIQQHLQSMFYLLRHEETLKMAVKLESQRPNRTRYLAIVSRSKYANNNNLKSKNKTKLLKIDSTTKCTEANTSSSVISPTIVQKANVTDQNDESNQRSGKDYDISAQQNRTNKSNILCDKTEKAQSCNTSQDVEESCLLGIDCNEKTTIGLVLRILADTTIRLDGDGGFSISVYGKTHIFKPVSVQAMWSALQTLHKVSHKARENNFYPGGPSHEWVSYYDSRIDSERSCLNEWNAMDSLESKRPPSPDAIRNKPTEREETERVIRMKLKEIMMSVDLDEVTSKYIRGRLEEHLDMDLAEYKSFIDEEMLIILGQMDAPTEIFEHVYLGSEWNASNLEELQRKGVRHILNVTREIDNFFPGMFDYCNVRVYDDERTNLLKHWDNTFKYISRAKAAGSKVLVHCKMGVSRSASVVIAYAMKAYNWDFNQALQHVKERRSCIKPNKNFLAQLETYRGMLDAMKNKEKLQRSKSETNLKNTKDARLLPGSEPTPLIQALNNFKKSEMDGNIRTLRDVMRRSSSTSPNILQSSMASRQQSQSLENLARTVEEQDIINYREMSSQYFEATQNHEANSLGVKTIGIDLEGDEKMIKDDKKVLNMLINVNQSSSMGQQQIGSENDSHFDDSKTLSPVWTSSSQIIHQSSNLHLNSESKESCKDIQRNDLFSSQLDNVFDTEESKQNQRASYTPTWTSTCTTEPLVSRQSSCSSVDSAVFLAFPGEKQDTHSRHSSWGSGDNRIPPSRNSSWGSYDTNRIKFSTNNVTITEGQVHNTCEMNNAVENYPLHSGTVKRTKQKLEEFTALKKLCGDTTSESFLNEQNTGNQNPVAFQCDSNRNRKFPNRCNSEEIILSYGLGGPQQYNSLSVSAPDAFSLPKTNDNSLLEQSFTETTDCSKDNMSPNKMSSNVQSLKKSFEAKASKNVLKKRVRSLPSSPVAPHTEAESKQQEDRTSESKDFSVKGLVSKYQSSDTRPAYSNCKIRPKSFYESRTSHQTDLEMNSNFQKVHDVSKPPVPPIIKSTLNNVPMTDGISSHNCNYNRKVQQHGKTHPLARLSLSKQRFNTAAYNTM